METNTQTDSTSSPQDGFGLPVAVVIAGLLIAGAVLSAGNSGNVASDTALNDTAGQPRASAVNIADVDTRNEPFIGRPDAPVTLAYWGDFQCPFCKRFDLETLPTLVTRYVETGKLKVVFKDYQFLGPDSQTAGLAAKAVWELYPDRYFAWHQAMYEAQDQEHGGFGDKESIIKLTRTISGIDADKVASLIVQKQSEYQQEQDADQAEGAQFGINGTPGFVIGTQIVSGAQPASVFTKLIDAELNK